MHLQSIREFALILLIAAATMTIAPESIGGQQPSGAQPPYSSSHYPKYPQLDTADSYRVVEAWPQRPGDVRWGAMAGPDEPTFIHTVFGEGYRLTPDAGSRRASEAATTSVKI